MLIAACYVPASAYPFVELHVMRGRLALRGGAGKYILRTFSPNGGERMPKRTDDQNHARTYWTAATRGNQLPEAVFIEIGAD